MYPAEKVPVAVYCWVLPVEITAFAGVTAIETRPAVDPVPERLAV